MDGGVWTLRKKLAKLPREAAEVSAALDRADSTIEGVPHHSINEA